MVHTRIIRLNMALKSDDIVLVTGGAGFLGRHIIQLLRSEESVKELRVLDTKVIDDRPTVLGDLQLENDAKKIKSVIGSVQKLEDIVSIMAGCTAVIHCAGVVDFRLFPDTDAMNNCNVKGTANVIEACIQCSVPTLIFTSTIDVAVGDKDIVNGDENMALPERLLIQAYGRSKLQAEVLVKAANGRPLSGGDGRTLQTVCLRPSVMYGEGDPYLIPTVRSSTSAGYLIPVGSGRAVSQHSYVGNIAWAHVCALRALSSNSSSPASGHAYYINDDTPLVNAFEFYGFFLPSCGRSVAKFRMPYWFVYSMLFVAQCVMQVLRLVFPVNMKTTLGSLVYINHTVYFSRALAEERLGYVPKFDFETSLSKSLEYYKHTFGSHKKM